MMLTVFSTVHSGYHRQNTPPLDQGNNNILVGSSSDSNFIVPHQFLQRSSQIRRTLGIPNETPFTTTPGDSLLQSRSLFSPTSNTLASRQLDRQTTVSSPSSATSNASLPTYDADESLLDHYLEWLEFLITSMKRSSFTESDKRIDPRQVGLCRNNLQLQERGCLIWIPTCRNYTETGSPDRWTCEILVWGTCHCSTQFRRPWRYVVPKPTDCYGDLMDTAQLAALLGSTSMMARSQAPRILLPLGHCRTNPHFLLSLIILISIFAGFVLMVWPLAKGLVIKSKRKASLLVRRPADTMGLVSSLSSDTLKEPTFFPSGGRIHLVGER